MQIISDPGKINNHHWEEFVNNHPQGNFFQTPSAYRLLDDVESYRPVVIISTGGQEIQGLLVGIIMAEPGIKSVFTKRCIVWGGPLLRDNATEGSDLLIAELCRLAKECIYIEFRNLFDLSPLNEVFTDIGFVYKPQLNFLVDTSSVEESFRRLSKSKQRQIRQSIKNGAEIVEAKSEEDLSDFYSILSDLYKTKVKKPLPTFRFFLGFLSNPGLGKIFLVRKEGTILGGILCPVFNRKIIYEWYVAGRDGQMKNIFPSVLATWAAIKHGAENGFEYFDFLGAGSPDSDYGVREFKSKFGGKLIENGRYIKINRTMLYKIGKIGLKSMEILRK
jgi:lipid II:glycine glycyltransferase (peptidoglycan interpeptide bridge formation enzyme)